MAATKTLVNARSFWLTPERLPPPLRGSPPFCLHFATPEGRVSVTLRFARPCIRAGQNRCGKLGAVRVRAHRVEPGEPEPIAGDWFRSDYADACELTPTEQRTAEQWARATLEQGPIALRWFVVIGWRAVLRLRLGPSGSDDHVGGWPILLRTPETVVLGVESGALGRARLTFRSSTSSVSAASNIEFERRGARAIWAIAGLLHRQILPSLLGHAASTD